MVQHQCVQSGGLPVGAKRRGPLGRGRSVPSTASRSQPGQRGNANPQNIWSTGGSANTAGRQHATSGAVVGNLIQGGAPGSSWRTTTNGRQSKNSTPAPRHSPRPLTLQGRPLAGAKDSPRGPHTAAACAVSRAGAESRPIRPRTRRRTRCAATAFRASHWRRRQHFGDEERVPAGQSCNWSALRPLPAASTATARRLSGSSRPGSAPRSQPYPQRQRSTGALAEFIIAVGHHSKQRQRLDAPGHNRSRSNVAVSAQCASSITHTHRDPDREAQQLGVDRLGTPRLITAANPADSAAGSWAAMSINGPNGRGADSGSHQPATPGPLTPCSRNRSITRSYRPRPPTEQHIRPAAPRPASPAHVDPTGQLGQHRLALEQCLHQSLAFAVRAIGWVETAQVLSIKIGKFAMRRSESPAHTTN